MSEIQKLDNINIHGGQWLLTFQQVLNPFWNEVFKYWSELCAKQKESNQMKTFVTVVSGLTNN